MCVCVSEEVNLYQLSSFFLVVKVVHEVKKVHVSQFCRKTHYTFSTDRPLTWLLGFIYVVFPICYSVCASEWVVYVCRCHVVMKMCNVVVNTLELAKKFRYNVQFNRGWHDF